MAAPAHEQAPQPAPQPAALPGGLLPPSAALNRFAPPQGFMPSSAAREERRVRYGYRAAGQAFLIGERITAEVVPPMPLGYIPNGPAWLLGLINLHGNLVPVCDLGRMLRNGPDTPPARPMYLVLGKGDRAAGLLIDGYPGPVSGLHQTHRIPGLPDLLARHVSATFVADDTFWFDFDHQGFLEEAGQT
jgi:twitching motility protein PilI